MESSELRGGKDRPRRGGAPCCAVLLWLVVWVVAGASAFAQDRTVRVGIYENAPKVFTDSQGRPAGIFVDMIEIIARREGWTLEYVPGTWTEGLDRLEAGEIDLMTDVALTPEREQIYRFHRVPVISSWFQVYAREDSQLRSLLDLEGKRVLALERSVQQEAFSQLISGFNLKITIIPVPDYKTSFEMVARGEADAVITNRLFGMLHAAEYGLVDTAVVFYPSNLFFAARKEPPEWLLPTIDEHLAALKEDPGSPYYESLQRWTSERPDFVLPDWVRALGIIAATALLLSLAGSVVLQRQVNARTSELRRVNHEMELRIEERTRELAKAMERAQAADHLKSAFLATMSHELRTPLNSIIGFTGILLQELPGPLNDEQRKQLGMVQNSARHLLSLINDVLDISKIEAGQLNLHMADFDLPASIQNVANMVRPMAQRKEIALRIEISPEIGKLHGDQRRVEQIILNLLNNGVKFTDAGEVTLRCRREGENCLIAVSDTGIGIRKEDQAGLFRPFHQIETGLSRRHEGTGLGLSICKKLVGMMGGEIILESDPGIGSTFTVLMPLSQGESP